MPWSKPMTGEEMKAHYANVDAEARAKYTWDDCAKDLALFTPLRIFDAGHVVEEFKQSGIHPYDVLPLAKIIFDEGNHGPAMRARNIRMMLELRQQKGLIES